jgi:hypothetical protein
VALAAASMLLLEGFSALVLLVLRGTGSCATRPRSAHGCHLNELGNRLMAERILAEWASRPGVVEAIALPGARADRLRSGATPVSGGAASAESVVSAAADPP